jgi:SAM-dependent methyltransferase
MDTLALHEISEAEHRILNAFSQDKLMLLGELCRLRPGDRLLDLASGKGELLCQWSKRWGISGVGVDISSVFVPAARARATALGVASDVSFVRADAGALASSHPELLSPTFDVVSCIGATWIGGDVAGTIELLRAAVKPGGLILIGEPYWLSPPPAAALAARGGDPEEFTSLAATVDRFTAGGLELVELVMADAHSWDRYVGGQWWTLDRWLAAHPGHPDAGELRGFLEDSRHFHLNWGRQYLGWGVFVLRES